MNARMRIYTYMYISMCVYVSSHVYIHMYIYIYVIAVSWAPVLKRAGACVFQRAPCASSPWRGFGNPCLLEASAKTPSADCRCQMEA